MEVISVGVQSIDESEPTTLSVRQGCTARELQQVLHHRKCLLGDTNTWPASILLRGVRQDAAAAIKHGNVYRFSWVTDAAASLVGGCAGIQVAQKNVDILPTLFDGRGRLTVRFS